MSEPPSGEVILYQREGAPATDVRLVRILCGCR